MAVSDNHQNTPFSIAFFRGHRSVAKSILEIVQAQYSPEEKPKVRYRMQRPDDDPECDSDYDSEEESEDSDADEAKIVKEVVDEKLTIENVGQLSMKVKSSTMAKDFFNTKCVEYRSDGRLGVVDTPLAHVINNNDLEGLKFLLDMGEHFTTQTSESDVDTRDS